MAEALKIGYREAFERNEYANDLDRDKFKGLVVEITGLDSKNKIVQLICQTFETLKPLADFSHRSQSDEKDDVYHPQFDLALRKQAGQMSKHYELFYSLENISEN